MNKQKTGEHPETGDDVFHYELTQDEVDAGYVAFMTGPIAGTLSLADETSYDVSEQCVPVLAQHVGELHLAIHKAHHAAGRFLDVPLPNLEDVELHVA